MLNPGQVVLHSNALWRVDYVTPSRARLVPLTSRVTEDEEGSTRGVNISPNSVVRHVENVEQVQTQLELARVQRRVQAAEQALAAPAPTTPKKPARVTPGARSTGGWEVGPHALPPLKTGSQAAQVVEYIKTHPGTMTGDLAAAFPGIPNMHQCLSRLKLTGYLVRK